MATAAAGDFPTAKNHGIQLGVLILGALVTMFNTAVTNVALPSIASALDASATEVHLIADGYAIALTSFVLLAGAIGDRYGRRLMFLLGSGLVVPASIMASQADSASELVLWRMVAGLASAMLFPTTLSMITALFPDEQQRLRGIALWSGAAAFGAAIAPVTAGILLEYFEWGSVFLITTPLAGTAFVLGWRYLKDPPRHPAPVDWLGGTLTVAIVALLLYAVIFIPVHGLHRDGVFAIIGVLLATGSFIFWQRRNPHPLLDLTVFSNRQFTISAIVMVLLSFGLAGVMYLAAQYTQSVLSYSTIRSGFAGLPLSLTVLVVSPVSAKLSMRLGGRLVVTSGLVVLAAGFAIGLAWGASTPYLLLGVTYVVIGIGLGLAMTPTTNTIMSSLPAAKAGIGSAVNDLTRDLGSTLGIAINGVLASVTYSKLIQRVYDELPPEQQNRVPDQILAVIRSSLTGALEIATQFPGPGADQLIVVARESFIAGQNRAMLLGAGLCLFAAGLVWLAMPESDRTPSGS